MDGPIDFVMYLDYSPSIMYHTVLHSEEDLITAPGLRK